MRIALVAAFPFPLPQGSQAFVDAQARALREAGVRVALLCYGRGEGTAPRELELFRSPRWLSPVPLRAGPHVGKLLADPALAGLLLRVARQRALDAVLAHNAEAAAVALAVRPLIGLPVVYVVHTRLRWELPSYGPRRAASALSAAGAAIDATLARAADAVIVLSRDAERALGGSVRGPLVRIPPALPSSPPPSESEVTAVCRRYQLEPGRFALYSGNLDGYQELDRLAEAARALREPPVVATHARRGSAPAPLRTVRVRDVGEMRCLCFGAGVALLPRRSAGGFPVKLLNYMEASCAIVAYRGVADGLEPGRAAWLLEDAAPPGELAFAIRRLLEQPHWARQLGREARRHFDRDHGLSQLGRETLSLLHQVCPSGGRRRE